MKILHFGLAWFLVFLVQACAAPTGGNDTAAASANSVSEYTAQTGLSDQQRFREVLAFLEEGDPHSARVELIVYLDEYPGSDVAQDLLAQIDLPALDYFPEDFEEIKLASGQSLSTLSESYLGSLYQFHALAKYNGIAEPRSIRVGQSIRIPLTSSARKAFSIAPGRVVDSVNSSAPVLPVPAKSQALINEEQQVDGVNELHRQAVNAFRSQDLDKAISLWDQVLAIDPNYENARLQRSQAIELKNKLSNLN